MPLWRPHPRRLAGGPSEKAQPELGTAQTVSDGFQQLVRPRRMGDIRLPRHAVRAIRLQLQERLLRGSLIGTVSNRDTTAVLRQAHSNAAPNSPAATGNQRVS